MLELTSSPQPVPSPGRDLGFFMMRSIESRVVAWSPERNPAVAVLLAAPASGEAGCIAAPGGIGAQDEKNHAEANMKVPANILLWDNCFITVLKKQQLRRGVNCFMLKIQHFFNCGISSSMRVCRHEQD